jgi:hypothetical protein
MNETLSLPSAAPADSLRPRRPAAWACALYGLRQALHWPLMWRWLLALWLPTLMLVWPLWRWSAQALDHSVLGQRLQASLDPALLAEVFMQGSKQGPGAAPSILLACLSLFLLLPYLNSLVVQAIKSGQKPRGTPQGFRRVWADYPVLLRLQAWAWLGALLLLVLGGALSSALQAWASRQLVQGPSHWLQLALATGMGGLLLLWQFSVDAAKAELALAGGDRAWALWWRGWRRCQQQPAGFLAWLVAVWVTLPLMAWLASQRAGTHALGDWYGLTAWIWLQLLIAAMVISRTGRVFALARCWR